MYVRATALALPLLLGLACKTTSSQSETSSAQAARPEPPVPQEAAPGGTSSAEASATGDAATGSGSSSSTDPSASYDSSASQNTLAEPGEEIRGHPSDEIVTGRIAKVSRRSISIASDTGEQKTLQLAPETTVVIDGREAQRSDLEEGQEVRASFNQVYGREVAVEVHAGEGALRSSDPGSSSELDGGSGRSWESGAGGSSSSSGSDAGATGAEDPPQGSGRK